MGRGGRRRAGVAGRARSHRGRRTAAVHRQFTAALGAAVLTTCALAAMPDPPASATAASLPPVAVSPAAAVDPFAGTGTGAVNPGSIGEFPAADLPFGMIQFGPDTSPDRISGSGYSYTDDRISGFSLTHLSGTGCASYGDVPILPTVGALGTDPASSSESFDHHDESAAPGRYQVRLGSPGIDTRLAVTTRTGLAEFDFPRTTAANLLFKVSSSAAGVSAASVRAVGHEEIEGQVTSGGFCQTGTDYTLYFVARFDRPFTASGHWDGAGVAPGTTSCSGSGCGAYVTFDTEQAQRVDMKVGISFVSTAGAAANLAAEDPGWSLARLETQATGRWNQLLRRVDVGGGTRSERRTFFTALYHSLLDPSVVSDADGRYQGDDGRVHRDTRHVTYANFSEWDIYRSEIELIALVAPRAAGDMVQSLVDDAQQGGWLPKWAIADGDAAQMNGDSADPIIAAAYAFGARGFDTRAALAAMVKGATRDEPPHGLEIERQYLDQYLTQHYVDAGALDLDSIDYSIGGSVTLEYAIDDFAIARLAGALGRSALAATMMERAQSWQYLFNPATGFIQARESGGAFPPGPAFNPALFEDGGTQGFEEGNAVQYTWSVPQNLAALAALMGGDATAVSKLDAFFTELNAGRYEPEDWAGNEPSLWTPWEYDYFGAPDRTEAVVRRIATTLYHDAPVDEPGNDDLGAMSSWYVWAAIGLYPVTPGTADLALASPLFPDTVVTLPDGRHLVLHAPGAAADRPYVDSLRIAGTPVAAPSTACPQGASAPGPDGGGTRRTATGSRDWPDPWLPAGILRSGAVLTFGLGSTPGSGWNVVAGRAGARPPSYGTGQLPAVGFSEPSGGLDVAVGAASPLRLGVKAIVPGTGPVTWTAAASPGLAVSATTGTLVPPEPASPTTATGTGCATPAPVSTAVTVTATTSGTHTLTVAMRTAAGVALPPVVVTVQST